MHPTTFEVRYVGKGHDRRAYSFSHRKGHHKNWINSLKKQGKTPRVTIIEQNLSEQQSLEREIFWIKTYKDRGCKLTNATEGGDGVSGHKHSPEARIKMGAANKGRKRSKEEVANVVAAITGKRRTDEQKANISASLKGKKLSAEHIAKLSSSHIGLKHTAEHVANRATSNTGKKRTKEQKEKMAKGRNGKQANKIRCHETGIVYKSVREAARQLGLGAYLIYTALKRDGKTNNFTFSYILETGILC